MKIICHPEVAQRIRQGLVKVPKWDRPQDPLWWDDLEIQEDRYMEREKPTGRYIDLQGRTMGKDRLRVSDRFVEYGPEDLDLLLFLGLVRPELEPLVYVINNQWRMYFSNYQYSPKNGLLRSSFV